MNRIIKIGIDVHTTNFTLCALDPYLSPKHQVLFNMNVGPDYKNIIKAINHLKEKLSPDECEIECGYEAGCLGYYLQRCLDAAGICCIILAPNKMLSPRGKSIKTDARDAHLIAQCLAHGEYSAVYVPTEKDESVKEFIRMRDSAKLEFKRLKQEIIAFCHRRGFSYSDGSLWTQKFIKWLREIPLLPAFRKVLDRYLVRYEMKSSEIASLDQEIEEMAKDVDYAEKVKNLGCLLGMKTHTALAMIVETGDFRRFAKGNIYASYLGLAPGEASSGTHIHRTGITKAGNSHLRTLLVEVVNGFCRGIPGSKSKALKARQAGNPEEIIAYADKANLRLRRKFRRMVLVKNKKRNVAVIAVARELACFIWGIMTGNIHERIA
jgi:transposase